MVNYKSWGIVLSGINFVLAVNAYAGLPTLDVGNVTSSIGIVKNGGENIGLIGQISGKVGELNTIVGDGAASIAKFQSEYGENIQAAVEAGQKAMQRAEEAKTALDEHTAELKEQKELYQAAIDSLNKDKEDGEPQEETQVAAGEAVSVENVKASDEYTTLQQNKAMPIDSLMTSTDKLYEDETENEEIEQDGYGILPANAAAMKAGAVAQTPSASATAAKAGVVAKAPSAGATATKAGAAAKSPSANATATKAGAVAKAPSASATVTKAGAVAKAPSASATVTKAGAVAKAPSANATATKAGAVAKAPSANATATKAGAVAKSPSASATATKAGAVAKSPSASATAVKTPTTVSPTRKQFRVSPQAVKVDRVSSNTYRHHDKVAFASANDGSSAGNSYIGDVYVVPMAQKCEIDPETFINDENKRKECIEQIIKDNNADNSYDASLSVKDCQKMIYDTVVALLAEATQAKYEAANYSDTLDEQDDLAGDSTDVRGDLTVIAMSNQQTQLLLNRLSMSFSSQIILETAEQLCTMQKDVLGEDSDGEE